MVQVSLRSDVARRTARLTLTAVNGTYTVTVGGVASVFVAAGHTVAQIVDGLVAAILANAPAHAIVEPLALSVSGATHDTVQLSGVAEADWSLNFTHTGAAVLTAVADLATANARLFWYADARVGSVAPGIWAWSGETIAVDRRGTIDRWDSAGAARLHVQLDSRTLVAGDGGIVTASAPKIAIGPCLSEVEVS